MKYLIISEAKEPVEENLVKSREIEKKRQEKGDSLTDKMVTPMFFPVASPPKSYWVVDCEIEDVMKWANDYRGVLNAKIIPVATRQEWAKL